MLVRKARIAKAATVRWKRVFAEKKKQEDEDAQWDDQDGKNQPYKSRMLACTRCGHQQETVWMQLRTLIGYRPVYCRNCGKQELSSRNKCQRNTIWHQCQVHRIDPKGHKSRKAAKFTSEQKQARRDEGNKREQEKVERRKKAPEIEEEKQVSKAQSHKR